ncbi:MAG: hypothetical protein E7013_00750 [Alphaproteobacteria bacterium]|nr:hypothetical protein [Alphaproteobacteria bacterium]
MKMQISKKLHILSAVALLSFGFLLTGCNDHVKEVEDHVQTVLDEAEVYVEQAKIPYRPEPIDTVTMKEDIWLGQDSFKMTGGEPFPLVMETPDALTISYSDPITLPDLIADLREMTGLKFSVDELRSNNELPEDAFQLNYSGSLSGLLDYISNKYSIWWKHKKGSVSFYKMETRVFTIYALPVESSMSASLSGTPISNSGSSAGGSTTLSMSTNVTLSFWQNIENAIKQVMGSQGQMLIDSTSGSVTVTAPPFIMQKIATYVQSLNEKLSRQVAISVKVLQVSLENSDQYGLNLEAVFNSRSFSLGTSGAFVPSEAAGMITMTLLDSKWKDSNSIIQALSSQGKTALVTSTSVTTLNNKVAPVQVTTQENYVKETTIEKDSYSSSNSSTSVEMETDTLNYGFTMEILPRILDNGRLIVLFSMTLTDLISLTTFSSDGSSTSGSTTDDDSTSSSGNDSETTVVQLPKMQTRGFVQEIAMRSGSTLVLTGFETVQNKTSTAGIGQPRLSVLGGKAFANQNRTVLVILLTPEILVSPLSPETRMENF